ncbi:hypothetical protein M378DRAFT_165404 [Amanita muscaria Koide BX008]|uniref:Uncharacterized protein n=1 Tax=Amanita muscaria (strain Koide BX008) TaxID=946122 RepID=A0A0C2T7Y3_AMAMK|nr:hypothetical protein M378DRAFT_165404 [Amanita muscaria Koide BX008]
MKSSKTLMLIAKLAKRNVQWLLAVESVTHIMIDWSGMPLNIFEYFFISFSILVVHRNLVAAVVEAQRK